jgi:hypothetical protein
MRETMHRHTAIALAALILSGCTGLPELRRESIDDFRLAVLTHSVEFPVPPGGRVDTVVADSAGKTLTVKLSREFSAEPFRPASVRAIYAGAGKYLTENFEGYSVSVEAQRRPIETLIPNIYRDDPATIDTLRLPRRDRPRPTPSSRT